MNPIERIAIPGKQEFDRYLESGQPVIIKGLLENCNAGKLWNPDYIANIAGERLLPAVSIVNGDYANAETKQITVKDYLQHLAGEDQHSNTRLYLAEMSIRQHLPELLEDIESPDYFFAAKESASSHCALYIGKSSFSQLHHHTHGSALLNIIHGSKRVRLYAPSETKYLYPYPPSSPRANMSRTTEAVPDPEKFPLFSKADYADFVLEKGETLFIPMFWWHAITNPDEVNVALVMFWSRKFWRRLPPRGLRAAYYCRLKKEIPTVAQKVSRRTRNLFGHHPKADV